MNSYNIFIEVNNKSFPGDSLIFACVNQSNEELRIKCEKYGGIVIMSPTADKPFYFVKIDNNDRWCHYVNIISSRKKLTFEQVCKLITVNVHKIINASAGIDEYNLEYRIMNDPLPNEYIKREFLNTHGCIEKNKYDLTILDSVSKWKFVLKNFSNIKINTEITIIIEFDKDYPTVPPRIIDMTPQLSNKLNIRIININLLKPTCWTKARSIRNIIQKIYDIIEERGCVVACEYYDTKLCIIIDELAQLSGIINITDLEDTEQQKLVGQPINVVKTSGNYVNNGTGYHSKTTWNISSYIEKQKENNKILERTYFELLNLLKERQQQFKEIPDGSAKFNQLCEYIMSSELIPSICNVLNDMSSITIVDTTELYEHIFEIMNNIPIEYYLSYVKNNTMGTNLNYCLNRCSEQIKRLAEDAPTLIKMSQIIDEICKKNIIVKNKEVVVEQNPEVMYINAMSNYRFGETDINNYGYYYADKLMNHTLLPPAIKRLACEFATLSTDLPINRSSSIFVRYDPTNISIIRVMIIGPKDTPYENGCFLFDIYIPSTYPNDHPLVQFINHGGVRFNPNLYCNGKVCLSLIGTWGDNNSANSENWQPSTSTIFQLLLSIQSQILVEYPWCNEPAYYNDSHTGKNSLEYNKQICYYTLKNAITNLLDVPQKRYGVFGEIIINHFKQCSDEIKTKYANLEKDPGGITYNMCMERLNKLK